jgi:hypothetical protein
MSGLATKKEKNKTNIKTKTKTKQHETKCRNNQKKNFDKRSSY